MALFSRPPAALIGVDITSSSVKVLQLTKSGQKYRVEHYAIEPLPPGVVVDHNFTDIEVVGQAIRRAMIKSGSKLKRAVVAVSGSSVITKHIPMSVELDEYELEDQVQLESGNHIPFPMEEVFMDFQVLGPMAGDVAHHDVLLAAARMDTVNARADALEIAGVTAEIVDVEPFAIERAWSLVQAQVGAGKDELVGLVDAGSTTTTLHVIRNGHILYSRSQPFGGKHLTDEIMRREGLTHEQVGQRMREGGFFEGQEAEVLQPFQEAMAQQVSRLLQFFYAASEHNQVHYIALAGGVASLHGLQEAITEQVGVDAIVINPLAQMTLGGRVQAHELARDATALLTVAGLAMRSEG